MGSSARGRPQRPPFASTRRRAALMRSLMARSSICAAHAITASTTSAAGPLRSKPSESVTSSQPALRSSSTTASVSRIPERPSRSTRKMYSRPTCPARTAARNFWRAGLSMLAPLLQSSNQSRFGIRSPRALQARSMASRCSFQSCLPVLTRRYAAVATGLIMSRSGRQRRRERKRRAAPARKSAQRRACRAALLAPAAARRRARAAMGTSSLSSEARAATSGQSGFIFYR